MKTLIQQGTTLYEQALAQISRLDWLAPLLIRLFLAPVFIAAGLHKALNFEEIVNWFGHPEWGLGLPFPALMAFLATTAELVGGVLILFGALTRLTSIPLIITMLVAIFSVHWQHGWFAIAPSNPDTSVAKPLALLGIDAAQASLENSEEVGKRLARARTILQDHGNYSWLTERGRFVVLNNGIEFGVTYLIMLMALLFTGPGRFVSVDYWLARWLKQHTGAEEASTQPA